MFVFTAGTRLSNALNQRPVDFSNALQINKVQSQELLQKDEGEQLTLITGLRTQVCYTQKHTAELSVSDGSFTFPVACEL